MYIILGRSGTKTVEAVYDAIIEKLRTDGPVIEYDVLLDGILDSIIRIQEAFDPIPARQLMCSVRVDSHLVFKTPAFHECIAKSKKLNMYVFMFMSKISLMNYEADNEIFREALNVSEPEIWAEGVWRKHKPNVYWWLENK